MIKKFNGVLDEDLVLSMKKGDMDAETELFDRYKQHAKVLGLSIYRDFRRQTYLEPDDLINCALLSVFKAVKKFNHQSSFKTYWSRIAHNDVMDLIKKTSDSYRSGTNGFNVPITEDNIMFFASNDSSEEEDYLIERTIFILKKNQPDIKEEYLDIMRLYLYGFSYEEIANKYKLTYNATRSRITKMRNKIAKILLHS